MKSDIFDHNNSHSIKDKIKLKLRKKNFIIQKAIEQLHSLLFDNSGLQRITILTNFYNLLNNSRPE